PFTLFNLGFCYLDLGQAAEAVPFLRRSLELGDPSEVYVRKVFAVLARAQARLGQRAEALATLRAGQARFADDPELLFVEGRRPKGAWCACCGPERRPAPLTYTPGCAATWAGITWPASTALRAASPKRRRSGEGPWRTGRSLHQPGAALGSSMRNRGAGRSSP